VERLGLRVTEPADVRELVELATVVSRLKILDSDEEPEIERLIRVVTSDFERECRRRFALEGYEYRTVGDGRSVLYLPQAPLEPESVAVEVAGVEVTDFKVLSSVGGLERDGYRAWPAGSEIVVTFRAGWLCPGTVATWSTGAASEVAAGNWNRPTRPSLSPLLFQATVGGDPGPNEPVWPTTQGELVVDGEVTWEAREVAELPASVEDLAVVGVREKREDLPGGIASIRGERTGESWSAEAVVQGGYSAALLRGLVPWTLDV
jgi:hypothetical protein